MQRSISTPKAMTTRPLVLLPSITTPPAPPTRPIGEGALGDNTTGHSNTANGTVALINNIRAPKTRPTVVPRSLSTHRRQQYGHRSWRAPGQYNRQRQHSHRLGHAGFSITGSGNVCIGAGVFGVAGVDDRTYIRNVNTLTQNFSAGVNDYVTVRLSDGRLGHTAVVSSQRYKEDVKPLDKASEAPLRAEAGQLPSIKRRLIPRRRTILA